MKYKSTIFLIICLLLFFAFILYGKNYLVVNEEPENADVIIVLSGDGSRLEEGATLYHEGYGKNVLLTTALGSGTTKEEAIEFGIPEEALILEEKATSTYTNAVYAIEEMAKHDLTSAVVVTSDYHTRRSKMIFERVFKGSGIELTYVASASGETLGDFSMRMAAREYVKLVGYFFGLYYVIDLE
ncbi:YdcF family protein [Ureibacillus aquaedulcis]|uniref:YdcF family protein n=1 Tax=Ureibacillus aquaedulcis TaxID=3058421 RepID=A0ABT8GUP0_9BACL|nr:YdcF family protein [Ureibacillus sp. BA0131]MDN4495130.1 YdcF family protein [Ureibacillus sp. BA0131]